MGTYVDQSCYEWPREELTDQGDSGARRSSLEISVSQMLDHGSISFGRFALEPLSWEKRSVFSHNRYQEELEKLRSPGLVAQKKAYFEEYYQKIRAMKAMQEKQHTEPASYCGDCSDISAHIMEVDRRVVPNECHEDVMAKTIGSGIEATAIDITLETDGETELVEPHSPAKFSNDNRSSECSPNSRQHQIFDINVNNHESMTRSIEDSERHDCIRVDNEQELRRVRLEHISGLTGEVNQRIVENENGGVEVEITTGSGKEKVSIGLPLGIGFETALLETDPPVKFPEDDRRGEVSRNKKLQSWDQNSYDHEPIVASIEDSKHLDFISQANEEILRKSVKHVSNDSVYLASSPKVLELKLNREQKKVNQAVKWHKSYAFTSELKEHSSSVEDFIKSEHKTKSNTVMLTQSLRDSSQKRNGENNVCVISTKQTADRNLCSKYASGASHGLYKEVHSKISTPRPFSFSTGKGGVSSTSVSPRSDAKNISSSSPLPERNIYSKGVSSRLGVSYSHRREKLENRRKHEELVNKPFTVDRQAAHLKGGSASIVMRPLKARSINLPTCRGGDTDVGTKFDNKLVRNDDDGILKLVEMGNVKAHLKEARGNGKQTIFHPLSRNPSSHNIKMASSTARNLTPITKNSLHSDNSSLNRRKLGQEKPRWR